MEAASQLDSLTLNRLIGWPPVHRLPGVSALESQTEGDAGMSEPEAEVM